MAFDDSVPLTPAPSWWLVDNAARRRRVPRATWQVVPHRYNYFPWKQLLSRGGECNDLRRHTPVLAYTGVYLAYLMCCAHSTMHNHLGFPGFPFLSFCLATDSNGGVINTLLVITQGT